MKDTNSTNESQGYLNQEELNEKNNPYVRSESEQNAYNFYTERFNDAKVRRNSIFEQFNDMKYDNDYIANRRAIISYLRRKKNPDDVRVNTGVMEKGIEKIVIELLSFNFTPEVRAFDKGDMEHVELGRDFTDLLFRTNEIERDEDKEIEFIYELIGQRALFFEEIYVDKQMKTGRFKACEKRLIPGLNMYMGDYTLPAYKFDEQPFIVKTETMDYFVAEQTWGGNENWQYVEPGMSQNDSNRSFEYRMGQLNKNEVEVIHYMSFPDNEYQVMINGVLMFEPGDNPLPWDWDGYNIKMIVVKPIPGMCYGKPPISSAKTIQALRDESFVNVINKWRQSIRPPMGVTRGKIYGRDIWAAGSISQGLDKESFSLLNPGNTGLTNSEVTMLKLLEAETDRFLGQKEEDALSKQPSTATAEIKEQKEAIKFLGLSVLGVARYKREASFMRIYNVLQNLTKSEGKRVIAGRVENKFKSFSIDNATLENKEKGKKIVQFLDRELSEDEASEVFQFEEAQKEKGESTRVRVINTKKLREIPLAWYVRVIPKPKESSELDKVLFTEKLNQAVLLQQTTGRPFDANQTVEEWETLWDSKGFFQKQAPGGVQAAPAPITPTQEGSDIAQAAAPTPQKPTVNTLANA